MMSRSWSLLFGIAALVTVADSLDSEQSVVLMVIHSGTDVGRVYNYISRLAEAMPEQVDILHAGKNGTFSLLVREELVKEVTAAVKPYALSQGGIFLSKVEEVNIGHGWKHSERKKRSTDEYDLESYNTYDSIREYIYTLSEEYPDVCTTEVIGETFEGREIIAVKVHGSDSKPRIRIFIDGTQHAREWISPAVLVFLINKLVTGYTGGESWAVNILEKYEFHIVPVVNADGYVYSHNTSNKRFWRKNRNTNKDPCVGVDLNRNWGFHWSGRGGSSNACSQIYCGESGFSEPETAALAAYIERYRGSWHSYFSFHSFGQMILFPWSHSSIESPDHDYHLAAGEKMAEGIKAIFNDSVYRVGSVGNLLYAASGSSESWAYARGDFPYSFTIELPNLYSFVLPKSRIAPTTIEIINGLQSYLTYIEETRPNLYKSLLAASEQMFTNQTTALSNDFSINATQIDASTTPGTEATEMTTPFTLLSQFSSGRSLIVSTTTPSETLANFTGNHTDLSTVSLPENHLTTDLKPTQYIQTESITHSGNRTTSTEGLSSALVTNTSYGSSVDSSFSTKTTGQPRKSNTTLDNTIIQTHTTQPQFINTTALNYTVVPTSTTKPQLIRTTASNYNTTAQTAAASCGPKCRKSLKLQNPKHFYVSGSTCKRISSLIYLHIFFIFLFG